MFQVQSPAAASVSAASDMDSPLWMQQQRQQQQQQQEAQVVQLLQQQHVAELRSSRERLRDNLWVLLQDLDKMLYAAELQPLQLWRTASRCHPRLPPAAQQQQQQQDEFACEIETTEVYVQQVVQCCSDAVTQTRQAHQARGQLLLQVQQLQQQQPAAAAKHQEALSKLRKQNDALASEVSFCCYCCGCCCCCCFIAAAAA